MWRSVITVLLAFALSGCGPMFESGYQGGPVEGDYGYGTPQELGTLLARRDAEDVLADRDRMMTEIADALAAIVPGGQWLPDDKPGSTGCGDFGSTKGNIYFSPHYTSKVPVPAALWNRATQAIIDIAARYGYTNVTGGPGDVTDDEHKGLVITDADGGRFTFGSAKASSMYVGTGCYLTAEDKRKAREAAPK
ncbi:LppA family lipoprotein [Mycolicibacterium sp. 141076]|uniref:LppA family lipoprotein n=1 Tax=Mycobacteriaceae TaxID=1762 RepID=UPI00299E3E70|nr:LppA family lipoprotein [Mycolicibacterium sp. 141076]MDX1880669.1 LppA family lipoprotein [Mycolicibacterium sp. 141076]